MYQGQLTAMDADDAFTGNLASMDVDVDFTMVPNAFKAEGNANHPDYVIEGRSPRGRAVRIGSGWDATSRAGNDYISLAINLPHQPPIRVNAIKDDEAGKGQFRIIPFADAA